MNANQGQNMQAAHQHPFHTSGPFHTTAGYIAKAAETHDPVRRAVPEAMDLLNFAINELEAAVNLLQTRLEPVLVALPPGLASDGKAAGVGPAVSPLAWNIGAEGARMNNVRVQLHDMLNRLEI